MCPIITIFTYELHKIKCLGAQEKNEEVIMCIISKVYNINQNNVINPFSIVIALDNGWCSVILLTHEVCRKSRRFLHN